MSGEIVIGKEAPAAVSPLCSDCGGRFIALRSDTFLCRACSRERQRAKKRRWAANHPEYMKAAHRAYMKRRAVCKIVVMTCARCERLFTRHGQSRGIHCRPCVIAHEKEMNAFRCLVRYNRLKREKRAGVPENPRPTRRP